MMYKIEHTKLKEVVDEIQIYFDPDDLNTLITEDEKLIREYKEFENIINDCLDNEVDDEEKSKWVIRIVFNKELLLDKNITMDDIHFALKNT